MYIIHGAKPKGDGQGYWRDANLLEKNLAGLGTKDFQLIYRLVRAHWAQPTRQVGGIKNLLVKIIKGSEPKTY